MQFNNISANDKHLFTRLVETRGFEYALSNFLLKVFDWSTEIFNINSLIWNEINKISTLTLSDYNSRDFNKEIILLVINETIPFSIKELLIYNIVVKTIDNENLTNVKKEKLTELFDNLINYPLTEDNVALKSLIRVFMNKIMYENDYDKQKDVMNSLVTALNKTNYFPKNSLQTSFMGIITVLMYTFIYEDHIVENVHKDNFKKLINVEFKNDLTSNKISFIKYISRNLTQITDGVPYDVSGMLIDRFQLDYIPDSRVVSKRIIFTDSFIANIRFVLTTLSSIYELKLENFIRLSIDNKPHQKYQLQNFVDNFNVLSNDSLEFSEKIEKIIDNICDFLNYEKENITNRVWVVKKVFHDANEKLKKLTNVENQSVLNDSNKIEELINYQKNDQRTSFEVEVDNNSIYGAISNLEDETKYSFEISAGNNDSSDLTDEILAGFVDSQLLSRALEHFFYNNLDSIEIEDNEQQFDKLINLIKEYKIDKYNMMIPNKYSIEYETRYNQLLESIDKKNKNINGLPNVFINSENFKFRLERINVIREVLTKDELLVMLAEKFRVSGNLYLIRGAYWKFDEAYNLIKKHYRKDKFIFEFSIYKSDKPGFIISFKK